MNPKSRKNMRNMKILRKELTGVIDTALAQEYIEISERNSVIESSMAKAQTMILSLSIYSFVAAIIFGVFISSQILKPINRINDAISKSKGGRS